jgi:hypothetical protein
MSVEIYATVAVSALMMAVSSNNLQQFVYLKSSDMSACSGYSGAQHVSSTLTSWLMLK